MGAGERGYGGINGDWGGGENKNIITPKIKEASKVLAASLCLDLGAG